MAAVAAVVANGIHRARNVRNFKRRIILSDLSDEELISRYRLTRPAVQQLVNLMAPDLQRATLRSFPIPVETQVLLCLRYFAKGDFLSEIADLHGVSDTSACEIMQDFLNSLNERLDNISFPNDQDQLLIKQQFYRKCKIPNCIGAVDGTLIAIQAPSENEQAYVCRKGYHALNIQAVVDHKGRFTDVVSKWPGSAHDASIFENSSLKDHLQQNDIGHLLADSGYPLRNYLLTPLLSPASNRENAYNLAHSRGRMVVERAFGILKSRFRCLHKTGGYMALKPSKCCQVVEACMRLHNYCMDNGIQLQDPIVQDNGANDPAFHGAQPAGAIQKRNRIIQLFPN